MTYFFNIAVPVPLPQTFTYQSDVSMERGQIVSVAFGAQHVLGCVMEPATEPTQHRTRPVDHIWPYQLNEQHLRWLQWISQYTMAHIGMVLKMMVPFTPTELGKKRNAKIQTCEPHLDPTVSHLTPDQNHAYQLMAPHLQHFQTMVLDGITGSGKTEVYGKAMEEVFHSGRQVLVLLPEIALTKQWLERFEQAFGFKPYIWNSDVSKAKKHLLWNWAHSGEKGVMVGARSALFLPFKNLGLIVMDEEHDQSYKQEDHVIYHARDMAVVRAKLENIPLLLASATPSLETIDNIARGRYQHIKLAKRFGKAELPDMQLASTRDLSHDQWITPDLHKAIQANLEKGEQSLLFLNRRGYAPLLLCRSCGLRFSCHRCDATLVWHKNKNILLCHYCGSEHSKPTNCPKCASDQFLPCGPGVERMVEIVAKTFPNARLAAITSDLAPNMKAMNDMWQQIEDGHVDIIIGTQMLAKGHNFPHLTLVGIVDADIGLAGGDVRAAETTFQLIQQVSGRAGRFDKKGHVIIQTSQTEHPLMTALVHHDRDAFYDLELAEREAGRMPPYGRLVALILSGRDHDRVQSAAYTMARMIPKAEDIHVLGPVPAPIAKIRHNFRWRFLVRASKNAPVQQFVRTWLDQFTLPNTLQLTVDVDPYNFM